MAVTESASSRLHGDGTADRHRGPSAAAFLHSYLAGNAVSELLPGGAATSAALQFEMLSQEGVAPARAASGMTAASAIVFGTLLLINILALPLVVLGVAVPTKLLAAAWVSAALLLGIVLIGYFAFSGDRFLTAVGRGAQWTVNKLRRRSRPVRGSSRATARPAHRRRRGRGQ